MAEKTPDSTKIISERSKDYILPEGHEWMIKEETSALFYAKYLLVFSAFVNIFISLMNLTSSGAFENISAVILAALIALFSAFQIFVAQQMSNFDPKIRWYLLISTLPVLILYVIAGSYFGLLTILPYAFLYYLVFLDKTSSRLFKTKNYMVAVAIETE